MRPMLNIDPSDRLWDVVVVGGGNAALCAAIESAEQGCKVLLLESAPISSRGGNSRHTRDFQRTADASQTDISGEIRLGSFASLAPTYLPGLIAELGLSYPDIELKISEGTQDQLIAGLRKGDLQVALVYDQELPDDLSRTPLFEARPQVVLPANHSLAGLKKNIAQAYCRGTDDATRYIAKSSLLHQSVYARRAGTSYSLSSLIAGIVAWPGWAWFRLFDTSNQTIGGLDL